MDMQGFGMAFYGTVTDFNILIDFLITVWQMPTILKLIKLCEKFIEQSELKKQNNSDIGQNFTRSN